MDTDSATRKKFSHYFMQPLLDSSSPRDNTNFRDCPGWPSALAFPKEGFLRICLASESALSWHEPQLGTNPEPYSRVSHVSRFCSAFSLQPPAFDPPHFDLFSLARFFRLNLRPL
jgi:hypothetical protein